jgi:hypothetical protein
MFAIEDLFLLVSLVAGITQIVIPLFRGRPLFPVGQERRVRRGHQQPVEQWRRDLGPWQLHVPLRRGGREALLPDERMGHR